MTTDKLENMDNRILLQINPFGPFLNENDQYQEMTKHYLEIFFDRPFSTLNKDILKKYKEITTKDTHLNITPGYRDIVEKLVKPLVLAKKHYCLGEYLSCIAVSGLIGEMLAILLWKITDLKLHGVRISEKQEEIILGKKFEGNMGQERRIKILLELKAINNIMYKKFIAVCKIRNKYLHSWQCQHNQAKGEGKKLVMNVFFLFKAITKINFVVENGDQRISMNPKLLELFKKPEYRKQHA